MADHEQEGMQSLQSHSVGFDYGWGTMDLSYPMAWDIWAHFRGPGWIIQATAARLGNCFSIYEPSQTASAIPLTKGVTTERPLSGKWADRRGQVREGANVVGNRGVDLESTSDWVVYYSTRAR